MTTIDQGNERIEHYNKEIIDGGIQSTAVEKKCSKLATAIFSEMLITGIVGAGFGANLGTYGIGIGVGLGAFISLYRGIKNCTSG
ncbi:MAG: hypothetical protein ChlgKO_02960 [Chlamydiales bacterium]